MFSSCEVRKPSKKWRNGSAPAQRRRVGDEREILRLLHRRRAEEREAGRPRRHHVGVVAEDRERMRRDRPGGDVDHRGRQLAGDLEHVREHQEQPLRGRERRCERPCLERAVHRPGGASLALHLDHLGDGAPDVGDPRRRPGIGELAHRRGGGDGVDRDHLAGAVRDRRGRLVAVDHGSHAHHRENPAHAGGRHRGSRGSAGGFTASGRQPPMYDISTRGSSAVREERISE